MQDRLGFSIFSALGATLPFLCGVLGAVIANMPVSILGGLVPPPLLAFMPVYFWCLVRPDLMPPPAALALGALEDLLCGGAMGVWALAFIAGYAFADRERDAFAGLSGFGAALGFAAAMLLVATTAFIIVAVTQNRLPPLEPVVLMVVMSVLLYLPVLSLLNLMHHRLIGPLRSEF